MGFSYRIREPTREKACPMVSPGVLFFLDSLFRAPFSNFSETSSFFLDMPHYVTIFDIKYDVSTVFDTEFLVSASCI